MSDPESAGWPLGGWSRRQALAVPGIALAGAAAAPAAGLSHLQLAGQRVIASYPGLIPPASLLASISDGQVAGVIFFGENIASKTQIAAVTAQLRRAQAKSPVKVPLLLMTDQEGGLVRRLPGQPARSEKQIGQSAHPATAAAAAGTEAGRNLAAAGLNVNLAPVLDVYYKTGNFDDQFQRSYSHNPVIVSECGRAFITAQQQAGVAAAAKHFPGLGSAASSQDTDSAPVTLTVPLATLRAVDELPYRAAVSAGVKLVMVSWALYPALDSRLPAGLSPAVIQQELRGRNKFAGVTVTDALEAGALHAFGTTARRAVAAASAGMDLILCSAREVSQGQAATAALSSALARGQLNPAAFHAAVSRVTALRASLH